MPTGTIPAQTTQANLFRPNRPQSDTVPYVTAAPKRRLFYAHMQLAEHQLTNERTRVEAWRLQTLINAGWTHHRATQIAERLDVDLHKANDLLKNGCPQRTALKILL